MTVGILAVGYANGMDCPHANQWLQSFDHEAYDGRGYGEFTSDPALAMRFADSGAAMAFWRRQSIMRPRRPDGKPNRPLTALTVMIEPLDVSA